MVPSAMNQEDRLGPYRLLRRLGEGGMGVVHLAVDPQGRQVAVKMLRAEVAADDVARRRLSREVETMRRVRNDHIAEVVDADVTGLRPYIVTRYVPGRPLDELVKQEGPLDEEALIRVGYGVADALAAVHAAGVIHRDLKPANVMMIDGKPVLIDFGIAQAVDATRLTQTGMFIGTPGYLAPEIISGQEAGPRGRRPRLGGHAHLRRHRPAALRQGHAGDDLLQHHGGPGERRRAPESLRPILREALSRDPARRPTAAELVERMARLLPAKARPGGSATPGCRTRWRPCPTSACGPPSAPAPPRRPPGRAGDRPAGAVTRPRSRSRPRGRSRRPPGLPPRRSPPRRFRPSRSRRRARARPCAPGPRSGPAPAAPPYRRPPRGRGSRTGRPRCPRPRPPAAGGGAGRPAGAGSR